MTALVIFGIMLCSLIILDTLSFNYMKVDRMRTGEKVIILVVFHLEEELFSPGRYEMKSWRFWGIEKNIAYWKGSRVFFDRDRTWDKKIDLKCERISWLTMRFLSIYHPAIKWKLTPHINIKMNLMDKTKAVTSLCPSSGCHNHLVNNIIKDTWCQGIVCHS